MSTNSLYLYDKILQTYFVVADETRFHGYLTNKSIKRLTKEEYFAATLPDWGIDIINSLSK